MAWEKNGSSSLVWSPFVIQDHSKEQMDVLQCPLRQGHFSQLPMLNHGQVFGGIQWSYKLHCDSDPSEWTNVPGVEGFCTY